MLFSHLTAVNLKAAKGVLLIPIKDKLRFILYRNETDTNNPTLFFADVTQTFAKLSKGERYSNYRLSAGDQNVM